MKQDFLIYYFEKKQNLCQKKLKGKYLLGPNVNFKLKHRKTVFKTVFFLTIPLLKFSFSPLQESHIIPEGKH